MKKFNPEFLTLGFVFLILSITNKSYYYIPAGILFLIAAFVQKKKDKREN